ncbi:unnamed protein product, partial [Adineta steineri]
AFKGPSTWHCTFCTSRNQNDRRYCNVCGKAKIILKHQESKTVNRKSIASMRPTSVSVRARRNEDKLDAENIFRDIILFCHQNNVSFVDDQFPPSFQSLGAHVSGNVTKWLRISEISPSSSTDHYVPWTICCSTPQPSDIQQGDLGNCWLLAALSLITERPSMLRHILLTQKVNPEGAYLVRLCHNGLWKTVILDDCFPCTEHNTLAFSKATKRQLYVPLIEKACAKLFGSYSSLRGGLTAEGLQLLTGAPCDRIKLSTSDEEKDIDITWTKLLSACESKLLIGTSTSRTNISTDEYHRARIRANHAFSVLFVTTLPTDPSRFLLIRDPHGNTDYSDRSIKSSIRTQLHSLYETHHSSGVFWISWPNFLHFFDSVTISTYASDYFDIREQAKFTRSPIQPVPAYYLYVGQTSSINISLIYHRPDRQLYNYHTQSFVLCDIEQESKNVGTHEIILQSCRGGFTNWTGTLKPGIYVLIPFSTSFWYDHINERERKTRDFTLVIYSSSQLNGTLINEPPTLLTDCLIAATLKYCNKSKIDEFSTFYSTLSRLPLKLFVAENKSKTHFLSVNMDITQAKNIRHSRYSFRTQDFIPPCHRQLICIVEWTNQDDQLAHLSYTHTLTLTEEWQNSIPYVDADQNDLHTPRAIPISF